MFWSVKYLKIWNWKSLVFIYILKTENKSSYKELSAVVFRDSQSWNIFMSLKVDKVSNYLTNFFLYVMKKQTVI